MVVINLLKKKCAFILLILLSVFGTPLCAQNAQTPSHDSSSLDLSDVIQDVCSNVVLANGLKQPDTTQTLAYLDHPELHSMVSDTFSSKISEIGLDFFKNLLKSVIQNEIRFKKEYYVFYHGQPRDFAFIQDLYRGLYNIIYKKEMRDFVMLRIPSENQARFDSVLDFLKYYIKNGEIFKSYDFDLQLHIKNLLLSVNPSLFGNTFGAGCSTLEYFLCSTGCTFVDTLDLVERIFEFFSMQDFFYENQDEIKELQELLGAQEKDKTGLLQQIFVPKNIVNTVAYRSLALGSLYYEDRYPDKHPVSIDLNDYESNRLGPSPSGRWSEPVEIFKFGERVNISSDEFNFDEVQFRLLMSGPMLDPDSGVKIFRYCNETPKFIEYKIKLKNLLEKIAREYQNIIN